MGKCKGNTKAGKACRRFAVTNTDFCPSHTPLIPPRVELDDDDELTDIQGSRFDLKILKGKTVADAKKFLETRHPGIHIERLTSNTKFSFDDYRFNNVRLLVSKGIVQDVNYN